MNTTNQNTTTPNWFSSGAAIAGEWTEPHRVVFLVHRNRELRLRVLREAVQVFQPVPGARCSSHTDGWAGLCPVGKKKTVQPLKCSSLFEENKCMLLTWRFVCVHMYTGSFDIKASRVQDCVGLDMTKYGHSQTGKIKSKLRHFHLWLFPVFFSVFF